MFGHALSKQKQLANVVQEPTQSQKLGWRLDEEHQNTKPNPVLFFYSKLPEHSRHLSQHSIPSQQQQPAEASGSVTSSRQCPTRSSTALIIVGWTWTDTWVAACRCVVSSSIRSGGWHSIAKSGTRAVYRTACSLVSPVYYTRLHRLSDTSALRLSCVVHTWCIGCWYGNMYVRIRDLSRVSFFLSIINQITYTRCPPFQNSCLLSIAQ